MKKRLISFIMMLVMLVSLFSVFATTASADAQVTTVTVAKGDTVLSICQARGIDFYTYKNLIMKLNGFTSESAFNKIAVGTQISLPVSNQAAASLANGGVNSATTGTTVAGGTTSGSLTTGTVSSLPSGDHVAYYLATYTVEKGETIGGIYGRWGLSYKTYANQIVKLNNLRSINAVQAGKTLLLPTTNPGLAGSTYTTVMAHTMRSGESVYNIICGDYGLNYNSAQAMLQSLNNRTNLGAFRVGEILYIPVSGVVSVDNTVSGGTTGGNTTTGTVNNSGTYNLVSETPKNGSFDLQVSGKSVKTASAGQLVNIVAVPDTGYAVDTIKVSKVGDTATTTTVTNNSFVMPSYSAIVSVTFKQAKQSEIKIDASSNGGIVAMVDNTPVSKAYAGTQVTIKTTPATGFMLDHVRVTYNDYRDSVAVENGKFTMPNFPVTVTATFKVDPDYNPTKGNRIFTDVTNATITAKIGDTVTEYAKAGERVTLEVAPKDNYVLESIKVYYDNFTKTVAIDKMSFDMPDSPVTVVAIVKPTSSAKFAINVAENPDGNIKITVDGKEVTSASPGQTVKIEASSSKAYYNYLCYVTKVGDSSTVVNLGEGNTFTMPDYAVTVGVKFYVYHRVVLDSSNGTYGQFNVSAGNTPITSCGAGVKLNVNTWNIKDGYSTGSITLIYADGSTYTLVNTYEFIMPDCDVRVRVDFKPNVKLVAHPAFGPTGDTCPNWGNSYTILGRTLGDQNAGHTVEMYAAGGSTVVVSPSANIGYQLDSINFSYTDESGAVQNMPAYKNAQTGNWQFELPAADKLKSNRIDLTVRFSEIKSYDIKTSPESKDMSWGSVQFMTTLGYTTKVAANAKVWIRPTVKSEYTLDWNKVKIFKASDGVTDITTLCSYDPIDHTFVMPPEASIGDDKGVIVDFTSAVVTQLHNIYYQRITSDGNTAKGIINCTIGGTTYSDFSGISGVGILLNGKDAMYVKAGTGVIVTHESVPGYYLKAIKVYPKNAGVYDETTEIKVTQLTETTCCFTMPLEDVIIKPIYEDDYFKIDAKASENGTYTVPATGKLEDGAEITDIKPAPGYTVGRVYMSYTDANGLLVEKKLIEAVEGKYIVKPGALPQSAVTVEVEFVPIAQDLKIIYEFGSDEGSVSPANTYKVDVLVDGVKQEIQRNTVKEDIILGGVGTGKTVVIRENTNGKDERFEITNIWVLYNSNSDAAEKYTNGDYYFTMPNVESGACEIHVRYALKDSNKYDLVANVTGGTIKEINKTQIDASSATVAIGIGSGIEVKVKPYDGYDTSSATAYLSYVDLDGVEQKELFNGYFDGNVFVFDTTKYGNMISILGKPQSDVKFTFDIPGAMSSVTALTGAPAINVDIAVPRVGDTVTVTPADSSKVISKVVLWSEDTAANNITETIKPVVTATSVTFVVPDKTVAPNGVYVMLSLEGAPAGIKLATVGSGTATMAVTDLIPNEGGTVKAGDCVTVTATADKDAYDVGSSLKVVVDGKELTSIKDYGNGTYQFNVPDGAKNIEVTVTFALNKHDMKITRGAGAAAEEVVSVNEKEVFTGTSDTVTGKVKTGDTVTVKPKDEGLIVSKLIVTYTGSDGKAVTLDTTATVKDGVGSFKIEKPIKVGEAVKLDIELANAPATP